MDLPRFILLKSNSNNKFLCYTKEKDNHGCLRFSYQVNDWKAAKDPQEEMKADDESEKMGFHHLKFEVEKAKTVEGLVHIRSCYNNKYWARKSVDNKYMAAVGNEAEEDQSKLSCTLFKPIFLDDNTSDDAELLPLCKAYKIRLLHISESGQRSVHLHTSNLLALEDECGPGNLAVVAATSDEYSRDDLVFTVFDVQATAILPEYATFMGYSDKYIASTGEIILSTLKFSASDIGEYGVVQQVTPTVLPQPTFIYDHASGIRWICLSGSASNQIVYLSLNFKDVAGTLFTPIKIGNYTALKVLDHDLFVCAGEGDTVVVAATGITEKAKLRVGEPVLTREITDATYDLADSRIYGTTSVEKFSDSRSNRTSVEQEGSFQVQYKTSQTTKWSNSVTVNIGVKVSWSAGIPKVGELGVDVSYDHGQTWMWGEEKTEEKTITYTQGIKIPPGKKVTLKVMAHKAFCDVPFTCKVRDLMTDGTIREYTKNDGLFSGCNEFQFDSDVIETDL